MSSRVTKKNTLKRPRREFIKTRVKILNETCTAKEHVGQQKTWVYQDINMKTKFFYEAQGMTLY